MKSILVFLSLFTSFAAQSFTLNNNVEAAFEETKVHVHVSDTNCQNIGLTPSELLRVVENAINRFWNTVPTSSLRLIKGQIFAGQAQQRSAPLCDPDVEKELGCRLNPIFPSNNEIIVLCSDNESDFSSANFRVLGSTLPHIEQGRITGSIMLLNDRLYNGDFNPFATLSTEEKEAVLAHEIGHAIGLGHSPVEDSLMYFGHVSTREKLGFDDIDGISYLYPKNFDPMGISCATVLNSHPPKGAGTGIFSFLLAWLLVALISKFAKRNN